MKLLDHYITVPTECTPVDILPFACVHLDNEGHSRSHWAKFKEQARQRKYAVILGLGDNYDWLRSHARQWMTTYSADGSGKEKQHSLKRLHDWREDVALKFAREELWAFRSKIALLSLGNHHHEFPDGTNDVNKMCEELGCQYGGHGGYLRLHICTPNRGAHIILKILYHHGEKIGGGSTIGGDINAMAKKSQGWDFDIAIFAHNHQKHGTHIPVMHVPSKGTMELIERPKAFIRAGCFMKGYVKDCVTYAEAAGLMNPTAIGNVRLEVLPKKASRGRILHDFEVHY